MKKIVAAFILCMGLGGAGFANATVIDFDDLVGPVVLAEQYSALGVHFSASENGSSVGAIAGSSLTGTSHTAPNVWSNCYPSICADRADILRIDFDFLVDNLSWYTDTAGSLQPIFNAYASDGSLLESILATATSEGTYALSAFSASGISYVELLQPNDDWGYYIDTISFDRAAVSEPVTLALFGLGLAGIGLRRRRAAGS